MKFPRTLERKIPAILSLSAGLFLGSPSVAEDWPQWGGTDGKNMVSKETNITVDIDPGKFKRIDGRLSEEVDMATTKNLKFVLKVGSQSYGTPTISNGKIYVGTNNETPRDKRHEGDRGIVMCFDEKTGKFLWQLVCPKLGAGKVSDWEFLGICSSPTIVGNRAYVITNRCEVICLDTEGLANGNDGPFKDEAKYMTPPKTPTMSLEPTDADIIWVFDMREELGVFPHNIASSSIVAIGDDKIVATTSNGVDWSHKNIPSQKAPSLCVLDAKTGELVGEEASGVSKRVLHCSWSSPALATVAGKPQIIFGAGDGWCYGLNPDAKEDDEGFFPLSEYWRYDCNPPHYRKDKDGKEIKYATFDGPSEVVATPVSYGDRIYVCIGQDPEHGEGVGRISCIDPSKTGDISGKAEWTYDEIERSMSTVSIADGLLFVADYSGRVHCLDVKTGEKQWVYDTMGHIWSSTMVVDGKVFIGNEEGELTVLKVSRKMEEVAKIEFSAPLYSSPVFANGTMYLTTQTHLYAFGKKD